MARSWFKQFSWISSVPRKRRREDRRSRVATAAAAAVEPLDRRLMLAVTASFAAAAGELRVTGDDQDNVIVVSRTVAGTILVNNGAVTIGGGTPTVANTTHFHIVGEGGNDRISLDQTNGPLPGAAIFGGAGNDTLTGGSADDFIDGETGNDTALLGAGDDTFAWNSGDGSDVVDGQAGRDSVTFNGSDQDEKFGIADSGSGSPVHRVRLTRDVGSVSMDLGTIEDIDLNALGGADTVTIDDQSATGLSSVNLDLQGTAGTGDGQPDAIVINGSGADDAGQVQSSGTGISATLSSFPVVNLIGADPTQDTLTLNGLGGNDTLDASNLSANLIRLALNGGDGSDVILGSPGDDQVTGGAGGDKASLGDGNDTFTWNAGDGSDVVEGQAGTDTLNFNGSNDDENINLSANGSRVRLTDDQPNVSLDIDGIEQASLAPLGGGDIAIVNDLAGTAIAHVKVKLTADGRTDNIRVNGSNGADTIAIDGDFANGVTVTGLAADVDVVGALGLGDGLAVSTLGGADTIDASTLQAGAIGLTLDGGDGNDTLTGSQEDDRIVGGTGNDRAFMGTGDDAFEWGPGDGSDTVEGQAGRDTMLFSGSDVAEKFDLSANGNRARLTRDVGNVAMDLNGVEEVDLDALGGADTITVNDQSATGLNTFNVDLGGSAIFADDQADLVIINATDGNDVGQIRSIGTRINATVSTIPFVNITGAGGFAALTVNTLGGNDTLDASDLAATNASQLVKLTINGGAGNDTLTGSQGADDFVWNPGDGSDTIEGGDNSDTLVFNGSDQSEAIGVSANGNRVRLSRDLGNVIMDLHGVEGVTVNARGGADAVTIDDLSGTGVEAVRVDLAAQPGGAVTDGQVDSVVVNGRPADDVLPVVAGGGVVLVDGGFEDGSGLPYFTVIRGVEATDPVRINGNGGRDRIDADINAPVQLSVNGGAQQDEIDVERTAPGAVVRILPSSGDDTVNVNPEPGAAANVLFDGAQRIGALNISGGSAILTPGGANVLTVTSVQVTGAGRLNLNDNALIVDYAAQAPSPIGQVRSLLASGFHGGAWDGAGITSGLANASTFALGYDEASNVATGGIFDGQTVDGTAVVVTFTRYGDATLDGNVDFSDLVKLAQNYNSTVPATQGAWSRGDFTYDGLVDFNDLVKLAQNYNATSQTHAQTQPTAMAAVAQGLQPAAAATVAALDTTRGRRFNTPHVHPFATGVRHRGPRTGSGNASAG
ncbi:MAG TPA: hypothetical protein VH475_01370 [Tepidisphaeraceae bacterium]